MAKGLTDGIGSLHPDYQALEPLWTRCRACHEGEDAVKGLGEEILPRPSGMTDANYRIYSLRADFLPAVDQTEEVLSGLLFREPPEVEAPSGVMALLEDVTLAGQSLAALAQDLMAELLITGRGCLVVDQVTPEDEPPRPYLGLRHAEDLINWEEGRLPDGRVGLLRVVLREDRLAASPEDDYQLVLEYRLREYVWRPEGVEVLVWVLGPKGKWVLVERTALMAYGAPVMDIPVLVCGAKRVGVTMDAPPLLKIANKTLSHYRTTADLEQGNFFASMPTPYVIGVNESAGGASGAGARPRSGQLAKGHGGYEAYAGLESDGGLKLGSNQIIGLPRQAQIGFLEIAGPGLASLHQTLDRKERQLRAIGARLVEDQKMQAETAQTARIRAQTDASLMRLAANTEDLILTQALRIMARWLGEDEGAVAVRLNREFLDAPEEPDPVPDMSIDTWPVDDSSDDDDSDDDE